MAKGYILVDVPEGCRDCEFFGFVCRITNGTCNYYNKDKKADGCPIRELPEKKIPSERTISPLIKKQYSEFDRGWNACLNYLEGK